MEMLLFLGLGFSLIQTALSLRYNESPVAFAAAMQMVVLWSYFLLKGLV